MKIKITVLSSIAFLFSSIVWGQENKSLQDLQQSFVDLKFGLFIHYNIPTYFNEDWPDPEADKSAFDPKKLDCDQWAKAAKSANMTYGCLTTKHHSGFCIWDTKTTDYNVMQSPYKKDVVREFVDAFRANGLRVMLYYSILDTHHKLRPNTIERKHIKLVKDQIRELLTNYGPVDALIIDGWDAPWSRISYDDIPFEEIYLLVKSLQPDCIMMDLNGAKYPSDGLYYSDIKTYEMGAGQHVSTETNKMPALACLPLQSTWFWKTNFPTTAVKDPAKLVNDILKPLNNANCNFILNVAPNRDGLFDDNAVAALEKIGKLWHHDGTSANLKKTGDPIISTNLATKKPANSTWSVEGSFMDLANGDNFGSAWYSHPDIKTPWYEVDLIRPTKFNTVVVYESHPNIQTYKIQYLSKGNWVTVFEGENKERVKVHRFPSVKGEKVRIVIEKSDRSPSIHEFGVYNSPKK